MAIPVNVIKQQKINCSKHGSGINLSCVECWEKAEKEAKKQLDELARKSAEKLSS